MWNNANDDMDKARVINEEDWKPSTGPGISILPSHTEDNLVFPGVFFIWDMNDLFYERYLGYLKVDSRVFDGYNCFEGYDSFVITVEVQDSYWDIEIAVHEGQEISRGYYIFFIEKKDENGNPCPITNVFFGDPSWDLVDGQVDDQIDDLVDDQIGDQIGDQVDDLVGDQIEPIT